MNQHWFYYNEKRKSYGDIGLEKLLSMILLVANTWDFESSLQLVQEAGTSCACAMKRQGQTIYIKSDLTDDTCKCFACTYNHNLIIVIYIINTNTQDINYYYT